MNRALFGLLAAACAATAVAASPEAKTETEPTRVSKFDRTKFAIPYTKHTLENGLTLLVHEDHSIPVVAVHLRYNVGSRYEQPGKTGVAHLFEHLFSSGSEHYPKGFREAMNDVGATNLNGFTDTDRTLFFEDVPASALERTLYLEADRMGFLDQQISKQSLDRERGIVKNEKGQGESQPYGGGEAQIAAAIYPQWHPYSRSTMGTTADLDSLSAEDARHWYRTYYGPNNCVLSLAGDVTPERALELAKKYFGDIPPGPPLARTREWVARLDSNVRSEAQERVSQAKVYRVYPVPGWRNPDVAPLEIAASVLSGSNSARLDRRLVFEKRLVTSVQARNEVRELAGQFSIVATVKAGVDPAIVEREIDRIVEDFLRTGPSAEETQRARMRELTAFLRKIEGLGARAGLLAESMSYAGRPDAYLDRLNMQANATPALVKQIAQKWLGANHYTLVVEPYPQLAASKTMVDRSTLPPLGTDPMEVGFPALQNAALANGLRVVLLERPGLPIVDCALVVDAGYAADPPNKHGLASLAMSVFPKATAKRDAFQIVDALDAVGARISSGNTLDVSLLFLEALSLDLGAALDIYADVIQRPAFPAELLEITRSQRLAGVEQEKGDPGRSGMSFVRRLLYGDDHPYAVPMAGFDQTIANITRDDVVAWHAAWFQPRNSTIVVSGGVTMKELLPQLERTLGRWQQTVSEKKKGMLTPRAAHRRVYLIDQPDAPQSVIVGAHVSQPGGQSEDMAIAAVIKGLGGMVNSRLNRNLRVEKQWSYNAWASLLPGRGPRTFLLFAPVRADKTRESLVEIGKELRAIVGEKPLAGEEFASLMRTETLSLPGRFATLAAIESAAIDMLSYRYPPDYYSKLASNLHALSESDLASAARKYIRPDEMIWIIRGDLKKIEPGIRELQLGDVVHIDASGRPID